MLKLSICFGSACHLRGAYSVLNAFKALIDKYQIQSEIDIEGNFCQGRCTEGVVIKLNDEMITNVAKEKVHGIFVEKVLGGKHN
ncbi:(2Fe-2S) ferredoxin domain-containing protein [Sporomusa acidovorans]|uniref:Respiratory-chain NADH dehydrogenase 24 Kd subunit n=1 Tax=Sporomusa acidovorans (strain ATCC 49682 / DSM 3132 / Mol) TaxID=1123286 RepID=A0ABZ3J473_SPOA4|nr:(2Fe-2S) ferredoxin domain-containing protein [Sporomusa acidovorans]OZC20901.1 respiratory-chain NADH dehydrogenase 24 Kd subunit [Sporomusa acidovorans DSM 3132]SDE60491.1 Thioredoxin-like [2Fe-2S] ferredoxin [Sporomusa acidovorans]